MTQVRTKLLHIISSLQVGGAEAMLVDLVAGLKDQFDQEVIYFHHGPHAQRLTELGIPIHQVKGLIKLYDPLFLYRLNNLVKTMRPDVIHTSLWSAGWLGRWVGKKFNIPVICAVHSLVGLDGRLRDWLDKQNIDAAAKMVAVSESVAESIYKQRYTPGQKIVIIRNGIDAQEIRARAEQKRQTRTTLDIPEDAFVVGSVGRYIASKRYDLLIETVAQSVVARDGKASIHLVLVGHGIEEQNLRQRVKELCLENNVHFIHDFPAYGYYQLFDCFALPSVREGLSMALLEAMSCGLPSIVTGQANQHEVIRHGVNGIVISPNNGQELFQAIQKLSDSPDVRAAMGADAANYVRKELNQAKMVRDYAHLFKASL